MELKVTSWTSEDAPTEEFLKERFVDQELKVFRWSGPPDSKFDEHTHGYHKILCVVNGSIKFEFPTRHETINLNTGDQLELPAGIRHNAIAGMDGVTCLEAHIY